MYKYDPSELKIVEESVDPKTGNPVLTFDYPVPISEAVKANYAGEPIWQITARDFTAFNPMCIPDNIARGMVYETRQPETVGGPDMFGVEWIYMPEAHGSMVRPGAPLLEDANDWEDIIKFPDITTWGWEEAAEANNGKYFKPGLCYTPRFFTGWFERLISFMDFEGAIMALCDDEQQDAVHALLDRVSDLYIDIIDAYVKYFPDIKGFNMHDDWGSQKNTFFAPELTAEMIVPHMRKVTDHIHSLGLFADLHSCGQNSMQVENMIAAGWDSWMPQPINDTVELYEKYGDRIMIAVIPEQFDPKELTEKEQRQKAREFVDRFGNPGKTTFINFYGLPVMTRAYAEELYEYSRKKFSGSL